MINYTKWETCYYTKENRGIKIKKIVLDAVDNQYYIRWLQIQSAVKVLNLHSILKVCEMLLIQITGSHTKFSEYDKLVSLFIKSPPHGCNMHPGLRMTGLDWESFYIYMYKIYFYIYALFVHESKV